MPHLHLRARCSTFCVLRLPVVYLQASRATVPLVRSFVLPALQVHNTMLSRVVLASRARFFSELLTEGQCYIGALELRELVYKIGRLEAASENQPRIPRFTFVL